MSPRSIALLTALGALALPCTAHATITAKRTSDGAVILSGAASTPTTIAITGSTGKTRIAGGPVQPGAGCFTVGTVIECGDDEPRRFDVLLSNSTAKLTVDYGATSVGDAPAWITSGSGNDDLEATGTANVVFQGGPGQDTLTGGAGDDTFFAEGAPDGADVIDGRGDRLGLDEGSRGDTVSYGFRVAPVMVSLPDDAIPAPAGSNGEAGEGDKLAHIESASGGRAGDLLSGNARGNRLDGRGGADTVDGGPGDDQLEVRRGLFDGVEPDPDLAVSCGSGEDVVRRDFEDPAAKGCEHDAPGVRAVEVAGDLTVGSTVSAAVDVYGDSGATTYQWMSCASADTACEKLVGATGPTFEIPPTAEGRHLQVGFTLAPQGFTATPEFARSPSRGPVVAAPPAAEPPVATPVPTPVPTPPAKPFADEAAELAVAGLGAGARHLAKLRVGGDARVFSSPAVSHGKLRLSRKGRAVVVGVVCPAACVAKVTPSVRAGGRTFRLPAARKALAARQLGTFSVALTAAQLRAVRRASKPELALRVSVGGVSATQRWRLQVAR